MHWITDEELHRIRAIVKYVMDSEVDKFNRVMKDNGEEWEGQHHHVFTAACDLYCDLGFAEDEDEESHRRNEIREE